MSSKKKSKKKKTEEVRDPAALKRTAAVLAICLASGAMMALSTPPWDLVPFPFLGMVVLAYLLGEPVRAKRGFRFWTAGGLRGLLFGTGTNLIALRFVVAVITRFTPLPWAAGALALVLLSLEQGFRFCAAAIVAIHLTRRGVPRWLSFGLGVYLSSFLWALFPWTVATGLVPYPPLLQLCEVIGERGVSLLMALSSGLAAEAIRFYRAGPEQRRRAALTGGAAVAIPVLMLVHGLLATHRVEAVRAAAPKARVTLIQPSIEATERWDRKQAEGILNRLASLTRTAERRQPPPDLTIWTEASYPYSVSASARYDRMGGWAIMQPGIHGPLLVGLMMRTSKGSYNSAVIVNGGRFSEPYYKMHLLAFGEHVPLSDTFPWLREMFFRGTGLLAGTKQVRLDSGKIHLAVLNCYEDTLPEAAREAMAVRPNLLVNITNDAWFSGTTESELHLRLAVLRAIEMRRDMVRAVNYGPTTWVDATGRTRARYDSPLPGTLPTEPALLEGETLYARAGDAPLLLLTVILVGYFFVQQKRKGRPAS